MSRVPRIDKNGNIRQFISQRTMSAMRRNNKPGHRLTVCGCGGNECFIQTPFRSAELTAYEAEVILSHTKKRRNRKHDHGNSYHNWWRANRY